MEHKKKMEIHWVPEHTSFEGNEEADEEAKDASQNADI